LPDGISSVDYQQSGSIEAGHLQCVTAMKKYGNLVHRNGEWYNYVELVKQGLSPESITAESFQYISK